MQPYHQLSPINAFADDLSVPPEFRRKDSDWVAVFNPRIKRSLDISLVHTSSAVSSSLSTASISQLAATELLRYTTSKPAQKYGLSLCHRPHPSDCPPASSQTTLPATPATYTSAASVSAQTASFSPPAPKTARSAYRLSLPAFFTPLTWLQIWDIAKKRIRTIFSGHAQEVYSLDFSLDGRFIISGSGDKTARIWNMHNGSSKVLTINDTDSLNDDAGVTSVAISPNGQLVAAGSLDTIVRIWDVATGVLIKRLQGHEDSVYSIAFTPDGRGLVSGSLDKTLKYWDVAALTAKMDFVGHK
ncbi:hypothetical protein C0992_005156, partial [Termitomyces sp. T32_za158]